jgi:bacillolysin
MNMKFTLVFALNLVVVFALQAQLKKVDFSTTKVDQNQLSDIIKPVKERNATQAELSVDFKTMDVSALLGQKSGLKPGIVNDKSVPAYIEGKLNEEVALKGGDIESQAMHYLSHAAPMMKIQNTSEEFRIVNMEKDDLGMTHVRMQQMVNQVPIYGAEIIIHHDGKAFDFLNGSYYPSVKSELNDVSISDQQVKDIFRKDVGSEVKYLGDIRQIGDLSTQTKLVIYPFNGKFYQAYHVIGYKNLIDRWEYFVHATTGEIIHKFQSICKFHNHKHGTGEACQKIEIDEDVPSVSTSILDGKATANAQDLFNISRLINTYQVGSKYYLIDGSRDIFSSTPSSLPNDPSGVIWTIDAFNTSPQKDDFRYDHVTSSNNAWSDKTGVSSHYNGGLAFEYFRNVHNRKSINGSGGNIISLINVTDEDGKSMGNAFWNGQAMFYGNGDNAFLPLARGLDVAGHEMSHGVIQSTANLEYQGESGALNESFADIFGAMIDRNDWKIGEDVVRTSAFPSGALRSMDDPHNGASTNNFNAGWQPRTYSERYKGTEDNGGVHINSGIPNWAFFKFATAVGKDKAEKVFYRTLSTYLTKSSQFVDCRVAVIKAAQDLYGTAEVNAAKKAFDEVGILGDSGGDYETDLGTNPGQEFVLMTGANNVGIFIFDTKGQQLGQLSPRAVLSKPSVSDDGSEIVYIGQDNKMYYITIDWTKNPIGVKEEVLSSDPVWRSVIISKDGFKIAALTTDQTNELYVFYFGGANVTRNIFELYNPTYTQGVTTGDVNYADAMEFDHSGEYIVYDAENQIKSSATGNIIYWDISFIKVWNNKSASFSLGEVSKLYSSLPKGVSIGNPSFSKNSPYILAFDYIDEDDEYSIIAANIETSKTGLIFSNNTLGYPNYSSKDDKILFDNDNAAGTSTNVGVATLKTNKIEPAANPTLFTSAKRWAVWFSNGKRVLSDIDDLTPTQDLFFIVQNPVENMLSLKVHADINNSYQVSIKNIVGQVVYEQNLSGTDQFIPTEHLASGAYVVTLSTKDKIQSLKFVKE